MAFKKYGKSHVVGKPFAIEPKQATKSAGQGQKNQDPSKSKTVVKQPVK